MYFVISHCFHFLILFFSFFVQKKLFVDFLAFFVGKYCFSITTQNTMFWPKGRPHLLLPSPRRASAASPVLVALWVGPLWVWFLAPSTPGDEGFPKTNKAMRGVNGERGRGKPTVIPLPGRGPSAPEGVRGAALGETIALGPGSHMADAPKKGL